MRSYLLRRTYQTLVVLFVVVALVFVLFRLLPGDPTAMMIDQSLDEAARAKLLAEWGLDGSLPQQFLLYLTNLARLNLGVSFYYRQPVWHVLSGPLWNTTVLMGTAIVIAIAAGIVLGIYLGWRRGSRAERFALVVALFLRSTPIFWLGILLLMVFTYWLHLFPTGGMRSVGYASSNLVSTYLSLDFLHHLALPLVTATLYFIADPMMVMRTSMLEVKGEDFLEFLESVGLSERTIMRHCARNALLPVVTFVSIMIGFVFGGQVLLEVIFAWPGIGREMVEAIERRDYPIAQASFLIMAASVIVMNLVVDLVYSSLDPRVTYE